MFDHNYLQTPNGENINFFQITNYGTDGMADAIWTVPDNFGSSDYVFIENNYFVGSFVYDCDFGGKIVLRYNIAWHGTPDTNSWSRLGCASSRMPVGRDLRRHIHL